MKVASHFKFRFFCLQSSRNEAWPDRLPGLDGPDQRPLPVLGRPHETRWNQFASRNDKGLTHNLKSQMKSLTSKPDLKTSLNFVFKIS